MPCATAALNRKTLINFFNGLAQHREAFRAHFLIPEKTDRLLYPFRIDHTLRQFRQPIWRIPCTLSGRPGTLDANKRLTRICHRRGFRQAPLITGQFCIDLQSKSRRYRWQGAQANAKRSPSRLVTQCGFSTLGFAGHDRYQRRDHNSQAEQNQNINHSNYPERQTDFFCLHLPIRHLMSVKVCPTKTSSWRSIWARQPKP